MPKAMARMPLAESVLTLWRFVADDPISTRFSNEHRGRCYEKILSFSSMVYLIRDALLEYNGSGHKAFHTPATPKSWKPPYLPFTANWDDFPFL